VPVSVDVVPKLVVTDPPSCPVHDGWDGMAPLPMLIT